MPSPSKQAEYKRETKELMNKIERFYLEHQQPSLSKFCKANKIKSMDALSQRLIRAGYKLPARKQLGDIIWVRVSPEVQKKITSESEQWNISRSAVVRNIVDAYYQNTGDREP